MSLPLVQPIVPTRKREPFDDPAWQFEVKYDGFRALWYFVRVPVVRDHGFRWKMITQSGGT